MYKVWLGRTLEPVLLSVFSLLEIFISFVFSMVFVFPKLKSINIGLRKHIFSYKRN
jgi:hypothetical protein